MRSIVWVTVAAILVALVGVPALAQDFRSSAMGEAGTGLADGPDAIGYNPAGLPHMSWHGEGVYSDQWVSSVSGLISLDIDTGEAGDEPTRYGMFYSGRPTDSSWGFGALYSHLDFDSSDSDLFGIGAGVALDDAREFTLGASVFFENIDAPIGDDDFTSFDIGAMWRTMDQQMNTWRVGLVATDVSEEYGNLYWRLGASVQTAESLTLAVDLFDVTDEFDSHVNVGAEYLLDMDGAVVPVRAGLLDGDLTLGLGYRMNTWELGLSFQDLDGWEEFALGATGWF